jgi:hypothetical protein
MNGQMGGTKSSKQPQQQQQQGSAPEPVTLESLGAITANGNRSGYAAAAPAGNTQSFSRASQYS